MKRSFAKVLQGVRQHSNLLTLAEQGRSPAEIKERIIQLLSPHFENQHVLNELAIDQNQDWGQACNLQFIARSRVSW